MKNVNLFLRKTLFILLVWLLGMNLFNCLLPIEGFNYPHTAYEFFPVNKEVPQPPFTEEEILKLPKSDYSHIFILFNQRIKTTELTPHLHVNKPYKVLHIKEMSYEWEGNTGIFLKDKDFKLKVKEYYTLSNGWYYLHWFYGGPGFPLGFFLRSIFKKYLKARIGVINFYLP
jgi:hypothetical protein